MAKGVQFSGTDDPNFPQRTRANWAARLAPLTSGAALDREFNRQNTVIEKFNEQWKLREKCSECGEDLIADELVEHYYQHFPSRVRPLLRMFMELRDDDVRDEFLKALPKLREQAKKARDLEADWIARFG